MVPPAAAFVVPTSMTTPAAARKAPTYRALRWVTVVVSGCGWVDVHHARPRRPSFPAG
jgi:hypothetical protein